MLVEKCKGRGGDCPCVRCTKFHECGGCVESAPDGYAADTDKLCAAAKEYCESGVVSGLFRKSYDCEEWYGHDYKCLKCGSYTMAIDSNGDDVAPCFCAHCGEKFTCEVL